MAYFNNTNNADLYSTSFVFGEPDAYPFLSQLSATEEVDVSQTYGCLADRWGMVGQPRPMVGSPTSLRATDSYESVAAASWYPPRTNTGYEQPSYSGHYWPAGGQQARPHHSDPSNWGGSFASAVAPGPFTAAPAPSSVPLDYWGLDQSGPSTSTFYENVYTSHQPTTGPTRTGLMSTGRFQPYGTSRVRRNEHRNAEAGPSTLVPPPVPYVGPPTPQPSGGISETAADADTTQSIIEEHKAPRQKAKKPRLPRGEGRPRPTRVMTQGEASKLCDWVHQNGFKKAPSVNQALAVALEIIPGIRSPVYAEPCLLTGEGAPRTAKGKGAREEFERRNVERGLYQELSRYYELGQRQTRWTRRPLLLNVLKDLEDLLPFPEPSDE